MIDTSSALLRIAIVFLCIVRVSSVHAKDVIVIRDTVEFRDFSSLVTCPASKLIAARVDSEKIDVNKVVHDWHVIEWPSKRIRFTVDAGETLFVHGYPERSYAQWSVDCSWLYYRKLQNGAVQVWRLNAESGEQEQVTKDPADVLRFLLTDDQKTLIYMTGATRQAIRKAEAREYEEGVEINEHLWPAYPLTEAALIYGRWATYKRWHNAKPGHLLSREPNEYKVSVIGASVVREATEDETNLLSMTSPKWVPENRRAYLLSSKGDRAAVAIKAEENPISGYAVSRLVIVYRGQPAQIHECEDERCSGYRVIPLSWSRDQSSLFFIVEQRRGIAEVYQWKLGSNAVEPVFISEGLLGSLASAERLDFSGRCPMIGDVAFCTAEDLRSPPQLIALSLSSGSSETVFDPDPDLRSRFALRAEHLFFENESGRKTQGVLVYPRDFKEGVRYPLVITTYWCRGYLFGGRADGAPEYALAEAGFFALCLDVNTDYPTADLDKSSKAKITYDSYLSEIRGAVSLLAERGQVDERRIGITGVSFSSEAISYALSHTDLFQAASVRRLGGAEPGTEMFVHPDATLLHAGYFGYRGVKGDEKEKQRAFEVMSMSLRADLVDAPILVQASDTEYLLSLPAYDALRRRGKPVEMIVFPDEHHFLVQPIHKLVNYQRHLDWFQFWLRNVEDSAPEKLEQYKRWRKLRAKRCEWDETKDERPSYCKFAAAN